MPQKLIMILVAAVFALGVGFLVRGRMGGEDGPANPRVLVAAADISQGSFVNPEASFTWAEWPEKNISESTLLEGKFDPAKLSGAVARRQILKGEPISENALVKSNEGGFMAAVLEPGLRAISIAVDSTTGNAGFIFPGDRVDLIVTHKVKVKLRDEELTNQPEFMLASETFVDNVRVLAVDQTLENPDNAAILAKTVTLEVSKQQAEKINVAKDLGKISLSLRSLAREEEGMGGPLVGDAKEHSYTRDSDVSDILNPETPNRPKVQLIRGAEREEIEFIRNGNRPKEDEAEQTTTKDSR